MAKKNWTGYNREHTGVTVTENHITPTVYLPIWAKIAHKNTQNDLFVKPSLLSSVSGAILWKKLLFQAVGLVGDQSAERAGL